MDNRVGGGGDGLERAKKVPCVVIDKCGGISVMAIPSGGSSIKKTEKHIATQTKKRSLDVEKTNIWIK